MFVNISRFSACSTRHLSVFFLSPSFSSVSASKLQKPWASVVVSVAVCFSRDHRMSYRNIDMRFLNILFYSEPSDFSLQSEDRQILRAIQLAHFLVS